MPVKLTMPLECCKTLDALDELLDIAHDHGGLVVSWGVTPRRPAKSLERVWVSVTGLPHPNPLCRTGSTLNQAAMAILREVWPDPSDQPDDPA